LGAEKLPTPAKLRPFFSSLAGFWFFLKKYAGLTLLSTPDPSRSLFHKLVCFVFFRFFPPLSLLMVCLPSRHRPFFEDLRGLVANVCNIVVPSVDTTPSFACFTLFLGVFLFAFRRPLRTAKADGSVLMTLEDFF